MPRHCCDRMRDHLDWQCPDHTDRSDCPDALINYSERFDEYGLIIHDGGSSSIRIQYCPWCGKRLPESKAHRWFAELEKRGITEPNDDRIPTEFMSDEWYRPVDVSLEDVVPMTEVGTITFVDRETSDEAVAVVKRDHSHVALTLSLKSNGDVLTVMTMSDASRLHRVLGEALA